MVRFIGFGLGIAGLICFALLGEQVAHLQRDVTDLRTIQAQMAEDASDQPQDVEFVSSQENII